MPPDEPSRSCQKKRQKGARDQVDGADIHVEQAVEVFRLSGFDGAYVADAGVVDQDIEAFEPGNGGGDGLGAGYVEMERLGGAEGIGQRLAAAMLMSAIQTKAPARTSSLTVASPIPLAPPVTRACRPSRRKGWG